MLNLYLDANIYLSFYHYSEDDIDELDKLLVLLEEKKVILYLPEQTRNEFLRNRENKIADAMKSFE